MTDRVTPGVELRAYIEHRAGDAVDWQVVNGKPGESPETLHKRGREAMYARRGLMTKGVAVISTCTVQRRTVTPWEAVDVDDT